MNTDNSILTNTIHQLFLNANITPQKFFRRPELTLEDRSNIAVQAFSSQQNNTWGMVSQIAKDYQISRTFVYDLLNLLKHGMEQLFAPEQRSDTDIRSKVEERILSSRFEGRSSIAAISTMLERDSLPYSSLGYISEYLTHVGKSLPNTVSNHGPEVVQIAFSSDEIFSKLHPILITVDPKSTAILSIELCKQRTAKQWKSHFQGVCKQGFYPKVVSSDEGTGLCAARAEIFSDVPWQLDTFHGIAHRLGEWKNRLEKQAYKAIQVANHAEDLLTSAKSDSVVDKRLSCSLVADVNAGQTIDIYDDFCYLYHYLVHQLNIFNANGDLRQRDNVKQNMEVALELMASLQHEDINKEVGHIRNKLSDLLTYFDAATEAVEQCQKLEVKDDALKALCLAWQWSKAVIKSKKTARRHRAIQQRDLHLELAALLINNEQRYLEIQPAVFNELDEIVQASSIVECINSILRPYLNTSKNQVTQEFLNTFIFYHNHRRYRAGKRKGKTPMEMLTGQEQKEDWIALLRKECRKNQET